VHATHTILAYKYELPRPAELTPLRAPFRQNGAKVHLPSPQSSANSWDGKVDGNSAVGAARVSASSGRMGAVEPMLEKMNFFNVGAAPAEKHAGPFAASTGLSDDELNTWAAVVA
jgi:hypothetical protein